MLVLYNLNYGDEIGMYGFRDPYNRLGFSHNNKDEDLLNHYIELSKFRNENKNDFITNFEFIYTNEKCVAYKRNNILCIINLDSKAHFIEDYSGEKIFGNNEIYPTPFGTVVAPNSYVAIKIK